MSLFQNLDPRRSPQAVREGSDELLKLRDFLLQHILNTVLLLMLATYVFFWINPATRARTATIIFFSAMLVVTLVLALARGMRYSWRASIVLLLFFITGLFALSRGLGGVGAPFMVLYIILSALLVGTRSAIGSSVLTLVSMLGYGLAIQAGWLPAPDDTFYVSTKMSAWITKSLFTTLVAGVSISSIYVLINGVRGLAATQQKLSGELEKERSQLVSKVEERTNLLNRNLNQINTAVDVIHAIGELRDPNALLSQVVELIRERFDLYYVGAFLLDDQNEYAVLRAGTGDAGRAMLAIHHRLAVGGASMIGWSIAQKRARIALDTGLEAVRFNNPYLPNTRSELAIPIVSRGTALGALTIQSVQSNAFNEQDISVFTAIAESLGVALENANLFREVQANLEEISALNRSYIETAWSEFVAGSGDLRYVYQNPNLDDRASQASLLQVPLTLRDQVIGEVTLETSKANLSPEELELVDAITTQTAIALENARLIEETQRRALAEQKLNEISALFTRSASVEDILKSAVRELGQLPQVSGVSVQLVAEEAEPSKPGSNGHHAEVPS
jgi:GAF domain-containing protein